MLDQEGMAAAFPVLGDTGRQAQRLVDRALEGAAKPRGPRLAVFVHVPNVRASAHGSAVKGMPFTMAQLVQAGSAILSTIAAAAR